MRVLARGNRLSITPVDPQEWRFIVETLLGLKKMNFDVWWLAYPLLGAFVGFFAGLLGVGGGGIMVPMLTTLFVAQGFPPENLVHMALGTSMAAIVATSVSSLRSHHRHGAVLWKVVRFITPGILIGTFGATFIASHVPSRPLAIFFVCFMAYVSVQMLLNVKPKPSRDLPGALGMTGGVGNRRRFGAGRNRRGLAVGAVHDLVQREDAERDRHLRGDRPADRAVRHPRICGQWLGAEGCRNTPPASSTCRRWCWSPR